MKRFDEWLTIFAGWKGPVPDVIAKGTAVSSLIKVKGFRNVIHWEVTGFDVLRRIELRGHGRGGAHIKLTMTVTDERPDSTFHLLAELSGGLLNEAVGGLVSRVLESDVRRSAQNLAALPVSARARG
jgi:hypothetical protein